MLLTICSNRRICTIAAIVVIAGDLLCSGDLRCDDDKSSSPTPIPDNAGYIPQSDPMAPITVGPPQEPGKKNIGEKAAAGLVGGLIGGVLGGSGSKSRREEQPKTRRDPTHKLDYTERRIPASEIETGARAKWTDDGLLVSTRIEKSPDQGTFQTIFLQSCDGRRLYPKQYVLYKLWPEHAVSVSWSKTTTSNGQVVRHETGAWKDSWTQEHANMGGKNDAALARRPAVWHQLGFERAHGGARQLGAYFNLSAAELAGLGAVALFVHTTQPAQDPVTTVASYWLLSGTQDERPPLVIAENPPVDDAASPEWQDWAQRCENNSKMMAASTPSTAANLTTDVLEEHSGVAITAATEDERRRLQQDTEDFWDAFELVGVEAKVIAYGETAEP